MVVPSPPSRDEVLWEVLSWLSVSLPRMVLPVSVEVVVWLVTVVPEKLPRESSPVSVVVVADEPDSVLLESHP